MSVVLLLDHKADIKAQDKRGETPIFLTIDGSRNETALVLLERGASSAEFLTCMSAPRSRSERGISVLFSSQAIVRAVSLWFLVFALISLVV
jgi:ankyrin repeat protein